MMRVITGCHQRNHNMNEPNTSGNRQRKPSRNWKPYPGDRTVIRGNEYGKSIINMSSFEVPDKRGTAIKQRAICQEIQDTRSC